MTQVLSGDKPCGLDTPCEPKWWSGRGSFVGPRGSLPSRGWEGKFKENQFSAKTEIPDKSALPPAGEAALLRLRASNNAILGRPSFQQGLIKVLFATETFAMGVNMPPEASSLEPPNLYPQYTKAPIRVF